MEENEPTAPASSSGQPRAMDKSAFELMNFLLYMRSGEEKRGIIMYIDTADPQPCPKCGEIHLTLTQFYYHYN